MVAATASGGATIAPRASAAAHGTSGMNTRTTTATAIVVKTVTKEAESLERQIKSERSERIDAPGGLANEPAAASPELSGRTAVWPATERLSAV